MTDRPPDIPHELDKIKGALYHLGAQPGIASRRRTLGRTDLENVAAAPLWMAILEHTEAIGFERYQAYMNALFPPAAPAATTPVASDSAAGPAGLAARFGASLLKRGLDPYQLVKLATEAFLLREGGVVAQHPLSGTGSPQLRQLLAEREAEDGTLPAENAVVPEGVTRGVDDGIRRREARERLRQFFGGRESYLDSIIPTFAADLDAQWSPFRAWGADLDVSPPLIELLWSYWHEEGMLSQTLNAVALRFQNVGGPSDRLGELAFDALRPLNSILYSYVGDEPNRLSVLRRAYEYNQQYGLALVGRATRGVRPADARSQFVEAFHNLLRLCGVFLREDDDTTVVADAFPVLNALKEVHLTLAEGAHNQFRDLPWTARVEMMVEQWIMARPEMREFLRGRYMVPYVEGWMGGVDAMKRLQGWTETSVTHFRDLAVYGERILLAIRHFRWMASTDHEEARTFVRFFRPEIQGYVHAYRAVTGVDLSNPDVVDATLPGLHLQRRLAEQQRARVGTPARQQFVRAPRPGVVLSSGEVTALIAEPVPVVPVRRVVRQLPAGADGDGLGP